MRIYVAGPISIGDMRTNIRNAILAAEALIQKGHVPFVPHLGCFWDLMIPHDYDFWMRWDDMWLRQCEALYRVPGPSKGSDIEERVAHALRIPVYYQLDQVPYAPYSPFAPNPCESGQAPIRGTYPSPDSDKARLETELRGRHFAGPESNIPRTAYPPGV